MKQQNFLHNHHVQFGYMHREREGGGGARQGGWERERVREMGVDMNLCLTLDFISSKGDSRERKEVDLVEIGGLRSFQNK